MNDKLKIEEILNVFGDEPFTSDDLYLFYQKYDPNLNKDTFRWRVYTLKNVGIINTLKRGVYSTENKKNFEPVVGNRLKDLYAEVQSQFPYIKICIWETSWLDNLMIHQTFLNNVILEIDKEAAPAVFAFLKESHEYVFLNPGQYEVDYYITAGQNNIIIKNLTVTSPLKEIQNITVPTIEKIMVDLFTDDELFVTYQGAELQNIYQELLRFYNVNQSTLKQYAHKRHKRDKLITFLKNEANIDDDKLFI